VVQHQVYKDATNPARALTLFSDATVHNKATNKIDRYIQPGMFYIQSGALLRLPGQQVADCAAKYSIRGESWRQRCRQCLDCRLEV